MNRREFLKASGLAAAGAAALGRKRPCLSDLRRKSRKPGGNSRGCGSLDVKRGLSGRILQIVRDCVDKKPSELYNK